MVDQSAEEAFGAINNVRGWWSGEVEGATDFLGAEFTYRYKDIHYSKQRVVEFVPGKRVTWKVLEGYLSFSKDREEWKGTRMVFDISKRGDKTKVQFTHLGLVPQVECYGACTDGWGFYIKDSLRNLIRLGKEKPNPNE
ncbi:MAG: SRPBCC domain-containing protein [Nitrososphaerota archaeon]|nr:SRPBCC domain-containing protein [Nitrososphaerota archaeon]